jgi:lipopolysaccharide transport system permease protein
LEVLREPGTAKSESGTDAAQEASPALRSSYHVRIVPGRGGLRGLLRDLWIYRELLYFLAQRDLKVRYKQTVIGAAWAILQPVLTMLAFSVFFGRLAGVPSDGIPYPVFALAGLLPWQMFAFALTESANSMVTNKNLITKVYFPRILVPFSSVVVGLVDFSIGLGVLVVMMLVYGCVPPWQAVWVPLFVLLAIVSALAMGLWLCALNVYYRDVRYTIPFLTQFGMLVTPVAYPASLIPERWRPLYGLNPMAGVVEGFRWSLLGGPAPGALIWVSALVVSVLLVGGVWYFRRVERTFADVA